MISQEALSDFKNLYLKEYGIGLTDEQAMEYGERLIGLIKAVYGERVLKPKTIDSNIKKIDD